MCEQTLNIKYQGRSDAFELSVKECDVFVPFQVPLISGHALSRRSMFGLSAKAFLMGSTAGQHTRNATEKVRRH